jgi:ceroid-lipofuscinosis protein 8
MFLLEASTPFSCICWCLLKLKLEKTKVWKINQWILIYVFHARTFYELWSWYIFYHDWDNIKQNMHWLYAADMFVGVGLVTFWLTPYWTYKKTAQYFFPVDWNAEVKGKKKDEIDKTS